MAPRGRRQDANTGKSNHGSANCAHHPRALRGPQAQLATVSRTRRPRFHLSANRIRMPPEVLRAGIRPQLRRRTPNMSLLAPMSLRRRENTFARSPLGDLGRGGFEDLDRRTEIPYWANSLTRSAYIQIFGRAVPVAGRGQQPGPAPRGEPSPPRILRSQTICLAGSARGNSVAQYVTTISGVKAANQHDDQDMRGLDDLVRDGVRLLTGRRSLLRRR